MKFIRTIRKLATAYQAFESISSKHIRTLGLTQGQFDVIATLGNQPPMTCSELAEKTLMVKGNLTVVLDGLLRKNLISKTANPSDARSTIITLTEMGNQTFQTVFPAHLSFIKPLAKQFSDKDLTKLNKYLDNFSQQINNFKSSQET